MIPVSSFGRSAAPFLSLALLLAVAACSSRAPSSAPASAPAPAAQPMAMPGMMGGSGANTGVSSGAMDAGMHAGHDMSGMGAVRIPEGSMITEADVRFMQGMIAHHAQAVHMTRLAKNAGARDRVLTLANKIDLSQAGEIVLMQGWLDHYGQVVPDTSSWRTMTMAGMLTAEQMTALERANGPAFDTLFLTFMIQHHEGALSMVKELFASPRAGQEVDISVFANDVEVTQTAEIGLMHQMLADTP